MNKRIAAALSFGAIILTTGLGLTHAAPRATAPRTTAPRITAPRPTQEATTYTIDPVHSTGIFRVHHFGAAMFYGRFNDVTGTITYNPEDPASLSFDVVIDVESVDTNTERLNNHLKSPDFFNAKEFSEMTFKSTAVSKVDDDTFEVTGNLTIRGITKTITTQVDLTGIVNSRRGKKIGFETIFTVDRSDYGVNYGLENGVLGREIRLLVSMEANAQ